MKHSESIKDIAAALAKAQAKMGPVFKNAKNPHFRSEYANLSSVSDACREALTGEGIAVFQSVERDETGSSVETLLMHSSGEWVASRVPLYLQKQDMQGLGSAITYGRRYGLLAAANLAPEDDDGNAASRPTARPQEPPFDAEAAEARLKAAWSEAKTISELEAAGKLNAAAGNALKAADPTAHQRVSLAYNDRKAALTPKEQAA